MVLIDFTRQAPHADSGNGKRHVINCFRCSQNVSEYIRNAHLELIFPINDFSAFLPACDRLWSLHRARKKLFPSHQRCLRTLIESSVISNFRAQPLYWISAVNCLNATSMRFSRILAEKGAALLITLLKIRCYKKNFLLPFPSLKTDIDFFLWK